MDATTAKRLARNEAFFREVNERIRETAERFGADDHTYEFICECADPNCTDRVSLSPSAYEEIRADSRRFVLAEGHENTRIEQLVAAEDDHVIVEKVGVAGEVAAALDPRAA